MQTLQTLYCCVFRTNGKWVEMTSVHWYKATSETYNTPVTLLDEDPIRREMANLKEIVRVSEQV
jgi:diaminopimelate decarboxylase